MRTRLLFSGALLLALLLSVLGNVLVAACPHMGRDHACCHPKFATHPAPHHDGMGDMQMDDTRASHDAEHNTDARAVDQLSDSCEYCMGRSQRPQPPATLREADRSKRGEDVTAPPAISEPLSITTSFVPVVLAREHAPPTAVSSSRHVLISVFRI